MAETPLTDPTLGDLFEREISPASGQFWDESGELMADRPLPTDGLVHHYTSIEVAILIVEGQELWPSNIAYLNDSTELVCARNVLKYLLSSQSRTRDNQNAAELLKKLDEKIGTEFVHSTFVLSFCDNGDLLGQWRGYGGGVSIAFDGLEIGSIFEETNLVKVIYSAFQQIQILDSLIMSFSTYLDGQKQKEGYNVLETETISFLRLYFENIAAKMKNEAFAEESEWRILTTRRGVDISQHPEVHFRTKNKGALPYLKIQPKDGLLPIKGITLSPNAHSSAESIFNALLYKKGYRGYFIKKSVIPFRD